MEKRPRYDFGNRKYVAIKIQNTDDYSIAKTEIENLNKIMAIRQTYEEKPEGPSLLNEENLLDE